MHQIFREALPGSTERSVSIQGLEDKICDVIDYILEQLSGTKVRTRTGTHTCGQHPPPLHIRFHPFWRLNIDNRDS